METFDPVASLAGDLSLTHGLPQRRVVVLLAGPPGAGKSTLVEEMEPPAAELSQPVQALSLDGFHLPNRVLDERRIEIDGETMPLRRVKGAPESYDLEAFTDALEKLGEDAPLRWPEYDREIHDPVADRIAVIDSGIVLVEGNWVLLDEPGWRDLRKLADQTWFLECDEERAKQGLLARHVRGGRSKEEALRHYEFSDRRNRERVLAKRLRADVTFRRDEDGVVRTN